MNLAQYIQRRGFSKTPEPSGEKKKTKEKILHFVVQKHHARVLHYDLRLEMDGVLKSWAVPKGPSLNPSDKRLAVQVEDHPYDYLNFEGVIPHGNYGAGKVIVWDEGSYLPVAPGNAREVLQKEFLEGHLSFILNGQKLHGEFSLVRLRNQEKNWLLIKKDDKFADTINVTGENKSVKSGLDVEELKTKEDVDAVSKSPMPREIKPMLASLVEKPFDDPDWIFEIKWDGYRAIGQRENGKVRLYSRNNKDFNFDYPQIVNSLKKINHDFVVDGEIVAVDNKGKSTFQLLQNYKGSKKGDLVYNIFDLLYLDGYDLRTEPLVERKSLIPDLIKGVPYLAYSDHIEEKGKELFETITKQNLEGMVAKKKNSVYVSKRSADWLKIKHIQEEEVLICGFTPPQGTREEFGSLLLGIYKDGVLTYVGHTGSGFDRETLQKLHQLLEPIIIPESPFPDTPHLSGSITWVRPVIIAQVKFSEITKAGIFRQAIFLGIRTDKKPEEVVPEHKVVQPVRVELTNPQKIYWPSEGYTKKDMFDYYHTISSYILPHIANRLQNLHRFPNGINAPGFYQKDIINPPGWIRTIPVKREDGKTVHYLLCENENTLLYMANLGCIEINPWNTKASSLDNPDYVILDLDPEDIPFQKTVFVARGIKKILDKIHTDAFIKTSGKRGLHILIPLGAKYTIEQTKEFSEILADIIHNFLPETTSIVRDPDKRQKKVYIDYLQNNESQTLVSPYSLRPVAEAPVSTPLEWAELTETILPTDFTIKTVINRLEQKGDIWKNLVNHQGINMLQSLDDLNKITVI